MCLYWQEILKWLKYSIYLGIHFSKVFNCKLPKQTVSDIIKKVDQYSRTDSPNKVRLRLSKYTLLEEALHLWFIEMRNFKIPVSDEMLVEKAKYFA